MKLILDAANIDTGGAFKQLVSFARYAAETGNEVCLFCVRPSGYIQALADSGVQVGNPGWLGRVEAWCRRAGPLEGALRLLLTWLWRHRQLPRLVSAARADVLFNPNAILPAHKMPGCAQVAMSQNMLPFDASARRLLRFFPDRLKLALIRRTQIRGLKQADGVVFISEHAARRIPPQVVGISGITSINYLGVDETVFYPREKLGPPAGSTKIIYVSGLLPYKHHTEVIQGVGELHRMKGASFELLLVGADHQGALVRLQDLAAREGVADCVRFLGALPESGVAAAMREADIGLFASSCENCPTTLIEKMKSGLPIASARLGPMSDILGEAGLYFDPTKPAEIAGALRRLLDDPALRASLGAAAAVRAQAYSHTRHNKNLLRFMADVAATMPARGNNPRPAR